MKNIVEIANATSIIKIEKGELISFKVLNTEYIHQKGSKGWRSSDEEMFPIIGPTSKNNFKVETKNGTGIQDQHGLLRELTYKIVSSNKNTAKYLKTYTKNTPVLNSKFPKNSSEEFLSWPFNFAFEKEYLLKENSVSISFKLISEPGMPFMLGYHPAFLLSNTAKETIVTSQAKATLAEVYKAGSNAFPFLNTSKITLENTNKNNVEITTENFNNFMLWTEVDNMLCIEPITQYTSYTDQKFSEKNMRLSSGEDVFKVVIKILLVD